MKIIIHSIEELLQLSALVRGGSATTKVGEVSHTIKVDAAEAAASLRAAVQTMAAESAGIPADVAQSSLAGTSALAGDEHLTASWPADHQVIADLDGAPYNTDWHSSPAKINADGRWKARRGRDADAYSAWLLEQAVEVAETAIAADIEPVATETHALPQPDGDIVTDSRDAGADYAEAAAPAQPVTAVDLQALVAASQEAAQDAADGLPTLLSTCRDFTSKHGTAEFNALKAAVAPRGDTGGSLQDFTPAERRLMQACIANYPKPA